MMANQILKCILLLSSCVVFSCCTCKFKDMGYHHRLICSDIYLNKTNNLLKEFKTETKGRSSLHINDSYIPEIYDDTFKDVEFFRKLEIFDSRIHTIQPNAFLNLKDLEHIDLSNNNLTLLNFNLPSSMDSMILSHNNISVVKEVESYKNLQALEISNNSLFGKMNLKSFTSLTFLNLSYNHISSLEDIPSLVTLDLSQNNISMIDFRNATNDFFTSIKTIDLNHNLITEIYEFSFKNMTNLESLNLSSNYIDIIHFGNFDDLIHLKELDLSNNDLYHLPTGLFYHQSNLRSLYIASNYLNDFEHGTFTGLEKELLLLDVTDNELHNLDAIYTLKTLRELRIRDNYLYDNYFVQIRRSFPNLERLEYNFPSLSCQEKLLIILKFRDAHVEIKKGDYFYESNINGIYCQTDPFFKEQESDEDRMIFVGDYLSRISVALIVILFILVIIVMLTSFTLYRVYTKYRRQTEIDNNLHTCSLKLLNENDPFN